MQFGSDEAVAQVKYQNQYDKPLNVECSEEKGEAIYRIQSTYSTKTKDRRFLFSCIKIAKSPSIRCKWYNDINEWDSPLLFTCPSDYYIAGIKSRHNNGREDRRWSIKCCRSEGYHTESCQLTKEINQFRQPIDYTAELSGCAGEEGQAFFAGLHSFHDNKQE